MVASDRSLRGHVLKLQKPKPRIGMLKYNYLCRVVEERNTLPKHVAEAVSLSVFKQNCQLTCIVVNHKCILSFLCVFGINVPYIAYKGCTLLPLLYVYYVFCVGKKI